MTIEDLDGGAEGTGEAEGVTDVQTGGEGEGTKTSEPPSKTPEPSPTPAEGTAPPTWREQAQSEISRIADGDDDFAKKASKAVDRFETAGDLVKSYMSLRSTLDKRVAVPGDEASDEERAAFFEKLGRPKTPDDYKLERPEGVPEETEAEKELAKSFRAKAHELNLTSDQVEQIYAWNFEVGKLEADARQAALKSFAEKAEETLRQEWTVDYDRNLELANEALQHYAKVEWQAFKDLKLEDGGYVGDHPVFARIFARVGADRDEDVRVNGVFDGTTRAETAKSKLDELRAEAIKAGKTLADAEFHVRAEPLYKEIYGSKPLTPMAGFRGG